MPQNSCLFCLIVQQKQRSNEDVKIFHYTSNNEVRRKKTLTFLERALLAEHGGVLLHALLHAQTQLRRRDAAVGVAQLVQVGDALLPRRLQHNATVNSSHL